MNDDRKSVTKNPKDGSEITVMNHRRGTPGETAGMTTMTTGAHLGVLLVVVLLSPDPS